VTCVLGASPACAGLAERAHRSKVAGIDVIVYPTSVRNVITLAGFLPAGDAYAGGDNVAVPSLTGMMLERGTVKEDQFAIAQKLENAGVSIGFNVGDQAVNIQGRLRKQNLALVVSTLAGELRTPAFKADEFEKARQQFIGGVQEQVENVGFRAEEAFERAVYPAGHPNRPPMHEELIAAAERATLDEVKAFHKTHYGPAYLTLIFVGDVNPAEVRREVEKAFAGWTGGTPILKAHAAAAPAAPQDIVVALHHKPSLSVMLGQPTGLRYKDPDSLALRVGTSILGSGFTGRLMSSVRDEEGLTYGIGASLYGDSFTDGTWAIKSTFAPALMERGITSTRRELQKWWSAGVTPAELAARKQNLIGSYQVGLASTGGIADAILVTVQRGYDLTWLDEYPKAVSALTVEQVNAAIRKYVDPDKMVLIKAGTIGKS
jgi:zinc protease